MWDSDVTLWNAADKGPKRDMKTIATFHHARNLQRYGKGSTRANDGKGNKAFQASHYPFDEGQPPTSEDPELRLLYGNVPEAGSKVTLESFAGSGKTVGGVTLLADGALEFAQDAKGLTLSVPAGVKNCKDATTFKIVIK